MPEENTNTLEQLAKKRNYYLRGIYVGVMILMVIKLIHIILNYAIFTGALR